MTTEADTLREQIRRRYADAATVAAGWQQAMDGPADACFGTSLYDDLEQYFVAAGLMRDIDLTPSFHLEVAYKASWHEIGDSAPQFAESPPA